MAPNRRQPVSVPSSVIGNGYLTAGLSGQFTVVDQRLVYASYPFMNVVAYRAPQWPWITPVAGSSNIGVRATLCARQLGLTLILVARRWGTIALHC